jgi:hypothetical protein
VRSHSNVIIILFDTTLYVICWCCNGCIALCVWNLLFWVPSLALDLALYDHVGSAQLGYLNMAVNFVVFYGLLRGARRLVFYLQRRGRIAITTATRKMGRHPSQRMASRASRASSRVYPVLEPTTEIGSQHNNDGLQHDDDDDDDDGDEDEAGPFTGGLHGGHDMSSHGLSFGVTSPSSGTSSRHTTNGGLASRSRTTSINSISSASSNAVLPPSVTSVAGNNAMQHVSLNGHAHAPISSNNNNNNNNSHNNNTGVGGSGSTESLDGSNDGGIRLVVPPAHSSYRVNSNGSNNGTSSATTSTTVNVSVVGNNGMTVTQELRQPLLR